MDIGFARARATVLMVVAASAFSACGGGSQPIATSAATTAAQPTNAGPVATAAPTATPAVTTTPTPPPTAEPEGKLEKVREFVKAWKSYSGSAYVSYQVILELKNTGTGWVRVSGFDSDYTVYDSGGGVTATGSFTYEFPEFIPSGGTGYLVADSVQSGVKVADFATVEIEGRYETVDAPEVTIEVSGIKLRNEAYSDRLTATGFLLASADVTDAAAAVICLAADGKPLGATWTNLIQNVTAGKKKGFETVGETPPLKISQCAKVVGYAQSTGF